MQYQNKSQNSHLTNKISNKKNNLSNNHDNSKDCQVQKIKSDNTFYSPVKYFSNNLQVHSSKYEQEELSPWQTNNDDQLNSSGIDFRFKRGSRKDKKRDINDEQNEETQSHTPSNARMILPSYNIPPNSNNFENNQSQISKSQYDQDIRQRKQYINQWEQNKTKECQERKEAFTQQMDEGIITEPNQQINYKQKEKISDQLTLGQLEIEQQNQLLAQIRRQRAIYVQQLQKKKQYSEELSKTAVMTTPKKEYTQMDHVNSIHRKNSSYSSANYNKNLQSTLNQQDQQQQQQQLYQNPHQQFQNQSIKIISTEGNISIHEDNIKQNTFQVNLKQQDESITSKNKNRILSILDNALTNQKVLFKPKEVSQSNSTTFYSLSHKASMIQKNLDIQGNTRQKLSEQYKQSYQNSKNYTNQYQKQNNTLQNSQLDEANFYLRRQSKTQDPNLQVSFRAQLGQENDDYTINTIYQQQSIDKHQQSIHNQNSEALNQQENESSKLYLSSNLSDQKVGLKSYLLNQQPSGVLSNMLQLSSQNQQDNQNNRSNSDINRTTFENIYETVLAQKIDRNNQTTYVQIKKSQKILNKENRLSADTQEDQNENMNNCKQLDLSNNHSQKNVSLLLPLFKGKKSNKEYKRVIKRIQRMQNTSPSQRRNTDYNNIDNTSFINSNNKGEYPINLTEESIQDYACLEASTLLQTQLPPINQDQTNKKKKSHSFMIDSSNILASRPFLYQGVSKINYISPNKIIASYQALNDYSTCKPQLSKEIFINDSQYPLNSEESIKQPSYEQVVRNFNSNIQKAMNTAIPDRQHNSSTTPKRQAFENSRSQPHSNQQKNNMQSLKQTDISTKKQKELISYYKPSQLLTSPLNSYPSQSINFINLSHSKIS